MTTEHISVHLDGMDAMVADLQLLAKAAERSVKVRNALVDFFGSGVQTSGVDVQRCATSVAGELWIEAKLCDRLAALVSAVRAGDVDAL